MHEDLKALSTALQQSGILPADAAPLPDGLTAPGRPWFISLLQGASGWLAGLFATGFIATLFSFQGSGGWAVTSVVLFAAAYGLYRIDKESAFFDQLALAFSIAAQCAFIVAIGDRPHHSTALLAGLVAVMECAVLLLMPNRFARLLATLCATVAWALAVRWGWWENGGMGRLDHVAGLGGMGAALTAWCLIWLPVMTLTYYLLKLEPQWLGSRWRTLLRPLLHGCILSLCFATLASQPMSSMMLWEHVNKSNWLVLWPLLSEAAALFALLAAFRLGHRGLMGAAIAAALLHLAHFYYLLGTTLLIKSLIMVVLGVLMLGISHWLSKSTAGGAA